MSDAADSARGDGRAEHELADVDPLPRVCPDCGAKHPGPLDQCGPCFQRCTGPPEF